MRQSQTRSKSPAARILSLALALCMIAAFVPAFTLTAGAAETLSDTVINGMITSDDIVFDGSYKDGQKAPTSAGAISGTYSGWAGYYATSDLGDVENWTLATAYDVTGIQTYTDTSAVETTSSEKNYLKFRKDLTKYNWGGTWYDNQWSYVTTPGYGLDDTSNLSNTYVALEWIIKHDYNSHSDHYADFWFYDRQGNALPQVGYDKNVSSYDRFGFPSTVVNYELERIIVVNGSDASNPTHDIYFQANTGSGYVTRSYILGESGFIDGFGSMKVSRGNYNVQWTLYALGDFTVYSGSVPTDSTAASIIEALDALELPVRADEETAPFALPTSATDTYGTTVNDVTWVSDSDVITIVDGTATVKVPEEVEYVHLTPSATYDNATVTGNAHTIVVFPASRAGDTYSDGTTSYEIGSDNIIETEGTKASFENESGFSTVGWKNAYDGAQLVPDDDVSATNYFWRVTETSADSYGMTVEQTIAIPDGDYALGTRWNDRLGYAYSWDKGLCSIHTAWSVEAGKSYYFSFYALQNDDSVSSSRVVEAYFTATELDHSGTTASTTINDDATQIQTFSPTTKWTKYECIFTAESDGYIAFCAYYLGNDGNNGEKPYNIFDDFELYEATAIEETFQTPEEVSVTVISGTTPVLPSTVTGTGDQGNTMTAEVEWEDITNMDFTNTGSTATEVSVTGTVKDTNITVNATVTVVPLSYTLDSVTAPISTAYSTTDTAQYISFLDEIVGEAYIELEYTPNGLTDNWIYINNGSALWGSGQIGIGTGKSDTNILKAQASSALEIGTIEDGNTYRLLIHTDVSQDSDTYTVVMSDLANNTVSSEVTQSYRTSASQLDRIVFTTNGSATSFTLSNIKVYDPNCEVITYNVEYIDSSTSSAITADPTEGTADPTYTTTVDNTLGYNDTVVCDYVPIPYFTGYVFKSKSVSGDTITLTYEPTDTEAYFFDTADDDATIISLNMLGAHDAFTANMDDVKYDAAGIATSDSGSQNYITYRGSDTAVNMSKAQSADALTMLNYGVRYFDVRVSRSTEAVDYEPTILGISTGTTYTAPHTNGVFYTTHGGLSDEFRPIAYTIGQWAKEHPGEIIILNFQSAFEDGGSATPSTWSAINDILDEAGINDFVSIKNSNAGSGNLAGATIASYTDNREHAGILVFGQSTGANNNIGNFILNKYGDEFSGRLYSNYSTDLDNKISSSYSADYIQAQVDYENNFGSGADNHIITWMLRVMQGQSESSNLVSRASSDNTSLYNALAGTEHTDWLTALPIIMVNDAVTNTDSLLDLLKAHNQAREVDVVYVDSDNTQVATKTKSVMTGTLYTDETLYGVVDGGETKYYVSTVPTTVLNNGIIPVPSLGNIESVTVTALGDVYTYVADNAYSNTPGTVITTNLVSDSKGTYYGYENFGAYNWTTGDGYDRIGVAVLPVDSKEETQNYVLNATEIRGYNTTVAHSVSFYAISYETYTSTDFGNSSAVVALLNSDNVVNTDYSQVVDTGERSDLTTVAYTLELNDALDELTTDGGKIVILGVSKGGLYGLDGSSMSITAETKDLGVTIIDGAQIRVGGGMGTESSDTEHYQELLGSSGLRFIATVKSADTLVAEADVLELEDGSTGPHIGIAIFNGGVVTDKFDASTAEDTYDDETKLLAKIDAVKYQDGGDQHLFTAAITNIKETNYNRVYVAVPYVVIGGEYVYDWDAAVARTPYEVAKGILVDGVSGTDTDEGYTYEVSDTDMLINVLNVYTNKTGARIEMTFNEDGSIADVGTMTYANGAEAFFTVSGATDSETGGYVITFTALEDATFYDYAGDQYRVNGAHDAFINAFTTEDATVKVSVDGQTMKITIPSGALTTATE